MNLHVNARQGESRPAVETPVAAVSPPEAWSLASSGAAVLLDVRTIEERAYVGRVPDSVHVPWATGTAMTRNPHFVRQVAALLARDRAIILLCRSGKRSAAAGEALLKAGFTDVRHVDEGFEGDLDGEDHRGRLNGWRHHRLPWVQD